MKLIFVIVKEIGNGFKGSVAPSGVTVMRGKKVISAAIRLIMVANAPSMSPSLERCGGFGLRLLFF